MRLFGLFGKKLGHSFSADWFQQLFSSLGIEAEYRLFEIDSMKSLPGILKKYPDLEGCNITIPFKKEVLPLCHSFSSEVRAVGASNCLTIRNKELKAFNTDVDGFAHCLSVIQATSGVDGAMILGTGGAAAAAGYVLEENGIPVIFVSRNKSAKRTISYDSITPEHFHKHPLIINATPLGMWPEISSAPPIPYSMLRGNEIFFDLVYNPAETLFMKKGIEQGCRVMNGLEMLHRQAMRSWEIWNGF